MGTELTQIETLSLRDYIDKEMTKLHQEELGLFEGNTEDVMSRLTDIMSNNSQLIALQEIAYRLEYGFIVEIGNTDLKHHLVKA